VTSAFFEWQGTASLRLEAALQRHRGVDIEGKRFSLADPLSSLAAQARHAAGDDVTDEQVFEIERAIDSLLRTARPGDAASTRRIPRSLTGRLERRALDR
jgi:hypothetical protein